MKQLLRFFFHHFYHAFAWTYDAVAALVSIGRWRGWVLTALPYLDGPRVLELGYGPGHLQTALGQKGLQAFGLDESRQMANMARSRLQRAGFPRRLSSGYAQSLPFRSGSFDNVVATFPTDYIIDPRSLAEIRRVLRPGGKLVVVPAAWIGGRQAPDRAAAWLFRVTQQGAEITQAVRERIVTPFAQAGFRARSELVEQRSSTVLVILAQKPAD